MNLKVQGEGTVTEVIARQKAWACRQGDCIEFLDGLGANSVQLVIGSPQYADKGQRYGDTAVKPRDVVAWVDWMLEVTTAARKASSGDVVWIVNGSVVDGFYGPAVEGLLWRWYTERGSISGEDPGRLDRPVIWSKNAPPNRKDWFGNDWEYCICFPAPDGPRKVWNWETIGTAPKHKTGGQFRQRGADGKRTLGGEYPQNPITRPRDILTEGPSGLIRAIVGGGHMGHNLAHENEAPFPLSIVEPFVKALTNPGDIVCDPFTGSGTTTQAAIVNGRGFVGCDIRESQVQLTRERLGSVPGW